MTRCENGALAQIMLALRQTFRRMDVQTLFDRMEGRP
jgi:hypothetical protein